jgi:hypothetical protein
MATRPTIPESQGPAQHSKFPVEKKNQFPRPLIAVIVSAAILAAAVGIFPRASKAKASLAAAQVPQQPTGKQIQFSELNGVSDPTGGAFYLTGELTNNGNTTINGILVQLKFKNEAGKTLLKQTLPVEDIVPGSNPPREQNLAEAPIKPGETRPFRIHVSELPAGWNHQIPEMKIITVTGSKP